MTTRIAIDLNVRARGNGTYSAFRHVDGPLPQAGDHVTVYEAETGLIGNGRVTEINTARKIIYLRVDWSSLHEPGTVDDEPSLLAAYASTARLMAAAPAAATSSAMLTREPALVPSTA